MRFAEVSDASGAEVVAAAVEGGRGDLEVIKVGAAEGGPDSIFVSCVLDLDQIKTNFSLQGYF